MATEQWRAASRDLVAGSCAGLVSTAAVYPLDVLRTRLQADPSRFHGTMHCLRETIAKEGAGALYRGLMLPLAAQAVYKAVIFSTNAAMRRALAARKARPAAARGGERHAPAAAAPLPLNTAERFACGATGGAVNSLVVTPVEHARNRIVLEVRALRLARGAERPAPSAPAAAGGAGARFFGDADTLRRIVAELGVGGLWRGLGPTMGRDALGMGCYFVAFDAAKALLSAPAPPGAPAPPPSLPHTMLAGVFAGVAFWTVALPFDTVQSLVHAPARAAATPEAAAAAAHGGSALHCARELVRHHGVGALYRGAPVAFGRGAPSAAITLATYDATLRLLDAGGC